MLQIVFVKWGTKYDTSHVNGLFRIVAKRTKVPLRCVCITEDGAGLDRRIVVRPFPETGMPDEWLATGCLRKLSMFCEGVLEAGRKTLYLDLDTAVLGDVARLANCLDRDRGLYMLSNHYVQHWKYRRILKVAFPRIYYFGNSSVMTFYPDDYYEIFPNFIHDFPAVRASSIETGTRKPKRFRSDERYISYHARETVRVFPDALTARFQDAYMTFFFWTSDLRDRLPWVRRRRRGRVALTFSGKDNKPERLLRISDGEVVQKGRMKTRWRYPELQQFWRELAAEGGGRDVSDSFGGR